ncbi:Ig-like domain-containing protein [Lyngbya aestuarii]|uniref:Ig-like domain-containing protein n=1 Tax=Lyngbya aestuarii TaxID=118322 RepID=UPI00403E1E0B
MARIEAESFQLNTFASQTISGASGGQGIRLPSGNDIGTATIIFNQPSGYYEVVIRYYDENDGIGQLGVALNGSLIDEFSLDDPIGESLPGPATEQTRVISQSVFIAEGDSIQIAGAANLEELVRVDYIDFNLLPSVEFSAANYSVNEDGTPVAEITINRTGNTDVASSVDLQLTDGTATGAVDYDNTTQTIAFAVGETTKTLTIPITDDAVIEGSENLTLTLANASTGSVIGTQDTASLEIVDNDVDLENNPPTAENDSIITDQNTPVNISVLDNDTDIDGDALTITIATSTNNGTVVVNDNGTAIDPNDDFVIYTPNQDYIGSDSFTYSVNDGKGGTATATVSIGVNTPVNNLPQAQDDSVTTKENEAVVITVLDNDTDEDNDTLTLAAVTSGTNGTTTVNNDGSITYTPNTGFFGSDTFEYTVDDSKGGVDTATVTVSITEEPDSVGVGLIQNADGIFTVQSASASATSTAIKFALSRNLSGFDNVDEIGFFVVDGSDGNIGGILPGEEGYEEAAFARTQASGQAIFSVLGNTPEGTSLPSRQLTLENGSFLSFYQVKNGTIADADSSSFSVGGSSFINNVLSFGEIEVAAQETTETNLTGAGLQGGQPAEIFDLRTLIGQVTANFTITSEAAFNNAVGLYTIDDVNGRIGDLNPGDAGYTAAAFQRTVLEFELGENRSATGSQVLDGGVMLASYIISNGSQDDFQTLDFSNLGGSKETNIFFAFQEANADKVDHFLGLGDNVFGAEDTFGGGDKDYQDLVFQVEFV